MKQGQTIPSAEVKRLTAKLIELKTEEFRLRDQSERICERLKDLARDGHYGPLTVYHVRETKVRSFWRRAYTAVRVNTES